MFLLRKYGIKDIIKKIVSELKKNYHFYHFEITFSSLKIMLFLILQTTIKNGIFKILEFFFFCYFLINTFLFRS